MVILLSEPITTLVGAPDLYINTGSTVNLTCIVQHSPEPPPAIKWMHNNAVSTCLEYVHLIASDCQGIVVHIIVQSKHRLASVCRISNQMQV